MVVVAISAIIMLGLSMVVTTVFHNMFSTQGRIDSKRSQFTMNELLKAKFTILEGVIEPSLSSPSEYVLIKNDFTKDEQKPFSYIGKKTIDSNDYIVFKDFFVFNGMIGAKSASETKIDNAGGITYIDSNYYVTSPLEDKIYICSPINTCSDFISEDLNNPTDITTDGKNLFVTDSGNNRVIQISDIDNTKTITPLLTDNLNFPTGIAYYEDADKNSYLFVSDTYNNQIKRITLNGNNDEVIVPLDDLTLPTGLAVDSDNNTLYIVDTGNDRVLKMTDPGPLTTATISFTPSNPSLNIGLIKTTFESINGLSENLIAENQTGGLHLGNYEVSGTDDNEFLYKFYTKLSEGLACISQDEGGCSPYNKIKVDHGYLLNGDVIEVDASNNGTFVLKSDYSSNSPYTHTTSSSNKTYVAGTNIVLKDNAYSAEQSFDLDLSGLSDLPTFNPVTVELFEANVDKEGDPYSTDVQDTFKLILINGDGILGTYEDIVEEMPYTGLNFPTGISLSGPGNDVYVADSFNKEIKKNGSTTDNLTPFTADFTSFDNTSDFTIDSISFSEPKNNLLHLEIVANIDDENTQTYTINAKIP